MGAVYAAADHLSDTTVALKLVSVGAGSLVFNSRSDFREAETALANEFQVLAGLRHPNIISVLDYGFHRQGMRGVQPFFTMELIHNASTITKHAATASPSQRIDTLLQTLQALSYLHERGILHRDLKPGNVLVGEAGAKVLDFGLALEVRQPTDQDDAAVGGTLAYIAPELFAGNKASIQSDLYAFGLLAVEVLGGQYPYKIDGPPIRLINQIMFETIDFDALGIAPEIAAVLARLTAHKPEDRFRSARAALEALANATQQTPPTESSAIRDSILQSARFIGREQELGTLVQALEKTMEGAGNAWLVGGESGVGKSRLLNELRIQALVRGALVLRGQALQTGDAAYQLFHKPVQHLLLATEVTDFEAGVLANYIPDVARILGRTVAVVPPLDNADAEHKRMSGTVVQLFERLKTPTLLLLEDLQWARLQTLQFLLGVVRKLPLLVVATYRNDEAPTLADELATMHQMPLRRLDENETAALTISMVGEAAQLPELLALIQEETEGNVFFLVETVRALAEEAGSVSQIGRKSLPARVFAGGIQQIVQRRIDRVPAADRPLLRMAAVLGRDVSVELLDKVIALYPQYRPAVDLNNWLLAANHAAVLEAREQSWRFAHDRLREHILNTINDGDDIYQHAALAVEALYPDLPNEDARVGLLAELWQKAQQPERELHYRQRYGTEMFQRGLNQPARENLLRAIELHDQLGRPLPFQLLYKAANQLLALGLYRETIALSKRGLATLTDPAHLAMFHAECALSYTLLGETDAGDDSIRQAMDNAEKSGDLITQQRVYENQAYMWFRQTRYQEALAPMERSLELAQAAGDEGRYYRALHTLSKNHYHLNNMDKAMALAEEARAYFEKVGAIGSLGDAYNNLGILHGRRGEYEKSLAYYRMCVTVRRRLGNEYAAAVTLLNMGVSTKNIGEYHRALELYAEAEEIFKRHEIRYARAIIDLNRSLALLPLERYPEAVAANFRAIDFALDTNSPGMVAHAAVNLARIAAAVGENALALQFVNALLHSELEEAHARNEAEAFRDEQLALVLAEVATPPPPETPPTMTDVATLLRAGIPGIVLPEQA